MPDAPALLRGLETEAPLSIWSEDSLLHFVADRTGGKNVCLDCALGDKSTFFDRSISVLLAFDLLANA